MPPMSKAPVAPPRFPSRAGLSFWPPQLAASFILNRACNVCLWHFADKPMAPGFVAYWANNGQKSAQALNGEAANDPRPIQIFELWRGRS
jgi:hypothetical protein